MEDFLLVGLGNPGSEYAGTRHNIGFMIADELCRRWHGGDMREKWQAAYSSARVEGRKIHIIKPLTYMNRSGTAVSQYFRFYRIKPQNMLVLHDDLDMAVARIKLVKGGGAGGHNGIKSIVEQLGFADFYRLKIGIGRPGMDGVHQGFPVEKYVLGSFGDEQLAAVAGRMDPLTEGIELLLGGDAARSMTLLNALK